MQNFRALRDVELKKVTPLAEGPAVLKDLLEMIKSMDRDHFSPMKELVASSGNSGEMRQD